MIAAYVLVCFLGLAVAGPIDSTLNDQWTSWKLVFNKTFVPEEELMRRMVWENNLRIVNLHNLEYSMGKHTYTLGMNEFAHMTNKEFGKFFNGYKARANGFQSCSKFLPAENIMMPTKVDWRDQGYVTPVKNQKQCGSCWAFSTTGSLEGQHFKKTGTLNSLSEQNLVDCSGPQGNMGCNGGLMDQAFAYIKENGGIDLESCYPYKAEDGKCKFDKTCIGATCTGCVDVMSGNETQLQQAAATVGPISVAIDASHSSFQLYRSGVYNERFCSSERLDHGVLVVGYGTYSNKDYWLVKNSWGETWGLKGYIMMSRNKKNQCGIATAASYPLV